MYAENFVPRRFVGYIIRVWHKICNCLTSQKTHKNIPPIPYSFAFILSIYYHFLLFFKFITHILFISLNFSLFYRFCPSCSEANICSAVPSFAHRDRPETFPKHFFLYSCHSAFKFAFLPLSSCTFFIIMYAVHTLFLFYLFSFLFLLLCKLHIYNILQLFSKNFFDT